MADQNDFLGPAVLDWDGLRAAAEAVQHAPTVRDTHDLQMGALYVPRGTSEPDVADDAEEATLLAAGLPPEDAKAIAIARWAYDQMKRAEASAFKPELIDSQRNQLIGIRNAHAETLRYLGFDPASGRPKLSIASPVWPNEGVSAHAE